MQMDPLLVIILMGAWFLQMGLHEGAHAIVADRLGDSLPRALGKVTVNPFRHIEWNNPSYVISAVVLPLVFTLSSGFPIGMAWVQHSPMSTADEAKVAIAGPIGSFLVAVLGILLYVFLFPLLGTNLLFLTTCYALIAVSVAYGVFNLVPLPGIDGGSVAYHFLPPAGRQLFDQIRQFGFFGILLIIMVLSYGTGGRLSVWRLIEPVQAFCINVMTESAEIVWGENQFEEQPTT